MILTSDVKIIGCTRSCNRSLNLYRVMKRSNISLVFSPSSCFSFSFLSRLETDAASSSRDSLFAARTPELSIKSHSGLIRNLKCLSNAKMFLDSTGLQSAMFLMDRLARLLDLPRDFFMLTHIYHVRLWLSIDWLCYDIANSLNPFLYRLFVSALFFVYY